MDKAAIKIEIDRLHKARNQLVEDGIYKKAEEVAKALFMDRGQLDTAGFEQMLRTFANDILYATKELR